MNGTETSGNRIGKFFQAPYMELRSSVANVDGQPVGSIPVKLLALYIFLVVSRVLDLSAAGFLHIPMILLIALILATAMQGDLRICFSSNIARWFAAFTAWVLCCFPVSTWRGASLASTEAALQAFAVFVIIVQLLKTPADWQKIAGAYAYAVLVASVLSFFAGHLVQGRLSLENGSLADPNEFALILVVGLPFWWFKGARAGGFRKLFFFFCTAPIFVAFARAGSRSGLIALCVLFFVTMLFASVGQKMLMTVAAVVLLVGAMAFLPEYLKVRFTTLFEPHTSAELDSQIQQRLEGDIGSTEGREMLLIQSIQMTFEHPVFGVGPGVFAAASWDERKKSTGEGGTLLVSHNTYTQISSETGIPGFILFVGTLLLCLKYAMSDYRAARAVDSELAKSGFYMFSALSALSVGIFFLSVGYTHTLSVMFALTAALHRIVRESLAKDPVQSLETSAAPALEAAKIGSGRPAPVVPTPTRVRRRGHRRDREKAL